MPTYKDTTGNEVVFNETPGRIVCLAPSITELLFDIGLSSEVVGITDDCRYPSVRLRGKTRVGPPNQIDINAIKSLRPDFIVASAKENLPEIILALRRKYPIWVADVRSLTDALDTIRIIGEITGKSQNAHWIATQISVRFENLRSEKIFADRQNILCLSSLTPVIAVGRDSIVNALFEAIGLKNIVERTEMKTLEALSQSGEKPQILVFSESLHSNEPGIHQIQSTFPTSPTYFADLSLMSWYGSRLLRIPGYLHHLFAGR